MRFAALLLIGFCVTAPLSLSAQATTLRPLGVETSRSTSIEEAAVRCGPHAHYVRGHRLKNGQYVRGRCVRDKRH